jgi:Putative DNA-binding domain
MAKKPKSSKVLSNYVAVTGLDDAEGFGILLPRGHGLLRTPGGHRVQSDNYALLLHMVRELEQYPVLEVEEGIILAPRPLCAYLLFSTQRDFLSGDAVIERTVVDDALSRDPVLYPSAGPEWTDQLRAWEPLKDFLHSLGAELRPRVKYEDDAWEKLVDALHKRWSGLSAQAKAVVANLHPLTEGNLVAAIAFASRACSEIEFAHAVLAASPLHHTFAFPSDEMSPEEQHTDAFRHFRDLARAAGDFLSFFPTESVALLVAGGESSTVEFKSTLRWDLHQGKKNDAVTHASLKTVAAFLNTRGGTLVIGVADDGAAVGIDQDGFDSDDRFLLHLFSVIKTAMGADVTPLVEPVIDMYKGKKVCVVQCKSSPRPVYVRTGGGEEFFVRTGPGSERLGPRELVAYIAARFKAE